MLDVWVMGEYSDGKGRGIWYCPGVSRYGDTTYDEAISEDDGYRIGEALAIISVMHRLSDSFTVHLTEKPDPDWVTNPASQSPLLANYYRILYRTLVYPHIESGRIKFVLTASQEIPESLYKQGG